MKRISTLVLSAAMLLGSLGAAHAIDVKVKGTWDFAFGWAVHSKFGDSERLGRRGERNDDNFIARQRVRTQVHFIASENLQGVLQFEIGNTNWGRHSEGGALDTDGINIETRRAYLDWLIPDTSLSIRMGLQGLSLPMATGYTNPVFSADVAAIVASYKFDDTFAITAFWARPFDYTDNDGKISDSRSMDDELDAFGVILPVTLDGVSITPWAMWARVGNESGFYEYLANGSFDPRDAKGNLHNQKSGTATGWWTGIGFAVDAFDPLTFGLDVMYGNLQQQEVLGNSLLNGEEIGAHGWFVAANIDYKLDWGTPGLFGWWSTGDSAEGINAGRLGRIPVVGTDDGFGPTTFGFAGTTALMTDSVISATGAGTWGIGLQIADMSFIEDLTHTIRFAYYRGTNDADVVKKGLDVRLNTDGMYLTDKDQAFEVNFDHKYQIYENLAAYLELGYINLDLDSNTWNNSAMGSNKTDDAWKAQVLLRYSF